MSPEEVSANWLRPQIGTQDQLSNNDVDTDEMSEQKRTRYAQDTYHRSFLVSWVVSVSSLWLFGVFLIIISCGLKWLELPTSVLNVLLATTTANILGLPYIVLKGLFPANNEAPAKKKTEKDS